MKENKISIKINKPISQEYTTNPNNTHVWISSIEKEETNEYPPKIGTIYRNHGGNKVWDEYSVNKFENNKIFELVSKDGNLHVTYTYTDLGNDQTEMEYFEWVDNGEIGSPFKQEALNNLKTILELI